MIARLAWWSLVAHAVLAGAACSDDNYGLGVGHPRIPLRDAAPIERNLRITEVFLTSPDVLATANFVEISNLADQAVDAAGIGLCSDSVCLVLPPSFAANERHLLTQLDGMGLAAGGGELALVDDENLLHDYFAWGAAPRSLSTYREAQAIANGMALEADAFVLLSGAAPAGVALAREPQSGQAGCARPSPGSQATLDAQLCP